MIWLLLVCSGSIATPEEIKEKEEVIEAFGFDCIVSLKHEIQGLARGGKMKKIFIKRAVEMQSGEDTSKHQNIEDETEYHRRRV